MKKRRKKTDSRDKSSSFSFSYPSIAKTINDGIEAGLLEIKPPGIICPNCKHPYYNSETCPYCQQDPEDPILIREKERIEAIAEETSDKEEGIKENE